jgi:protein gp37
MIELFHPLIIENGWTRKVLQKIACYEFDSDNPKQFILLTKRPDEARYMLLSKNIWLGTSLTGLDKHKDSMRIKHLRQGSAEMKFLSIEPLLGSMEHIGFSGISWIIVGGLTPFPRHEQGWIDDIIECAREKQIPIFLKRNANYGTKMQEFPDA